MHKHLIFLFLSLNLLSLNLFASNAVLDINKIMDINKTIDINKTLDNKHLTIPIINRNGHNSILKDDPYTSKYESGLEELYNDKFYYNLYIKERGKNIEIWLPSILKFDENFTDTMETLYKTMNNKEYDNIILDFRFHFGGAIQSVFLLAEALDIDNYNMIIDQIMKKDVELRYTFVERFKIKKKFKNMFILINEDTASGYELLTYALTANQNNNVIIIGESSYGKTFGQGLDIDSNMMVTKSIITTFNNLPIFKRFPDIYDYNISQDYGIDSFEYVKNIDKSLIDKIFEDRKQKNDAYFLDFVSKKDFFDIKNNIIKQCDNNITNIEDARIIFFNKFVKITAEHFYKIKKGKCKSKVECDKMYNNDILIRKENNYLHCGFNI